MNHSAIATERHLFAVDGMWCGGCARGLEARLEALDGVIDAGVHFVTSSALVRWDPRRCDREEIARCVEKSGYLLISRSDPRETSDRMSREIRSLSIRLAVAVLFGMWSMAAAFVLYLDVDIAAGTAWWLAAVSGVLAVPVVYSGSGFLWMAVRSLALRTPGIDLLVSLGLVGSTILSLRNLAIGSSEVYFDTATMLVTLLLVGRLVETSVRRGAIDALTAMDGLFGETAKRTDSRGGWNEVSCSELVPGDDVVVEAGAASTVDGIVTAGVSSVDRSIVSGESAAIWIGLGDRISAGTINLSCRIVVCVDRLHGDRDIDRMGGRIAIEIAGRGELEGFADRTAGWLVRGIPLLAFAVTLWAVGTSGSVEDGLVRGLAVLVVACPCALSIATPLAYVRAAAVAGRMGFRLRDPSAFERLASARTAIFDKTGTLTIGRPMVVGVEPEADWTEARVLEVAACAETGIDHPLARAIVERHGGPIGDGGERLARGATTSDMEGRTIHVQGASAETASGDHTRLSVSVDGISIGTIALADTIAPTAALTISALERDGIKVMIATGDAEGPALHVARQLGLEPQAVAFGCTPDDKAGMVRDAVGPVIFVGDGVNDGPAIAAADCGISVAGAHAAAAVTAAIVVTGGGIEAVRGAISLARLTTTIIRQNLALALMYNAAAIPAAAAGVLTPAMAAAAMLISSLSVVANALRIRKTDVLCRAEDPHSIGPADQTQSDSVVLGRPARPSVT